MAHALEAGQALSEAKTLCPDQKWTKWLAAHFEPSASAARGYMRLATYWPRLEEDCQRVGSLSYNEITRLIKGRSESPYARHLLHPLERIHDGLAGYEWHWHDLMPRR